MLKIFFTTTIILWSIYNISYANENNILTPIEGNYYLSDDVTSGYLQLKKDNNSYIARIDVITSGGKTCGTSEFNKYNYSEGKLTYNAKEYTNSIDGPQDCLISIYQKDQHSIFVEADGNGCYFFNCSMHGMYYDSKELSKEKYKIEQDEEKIKFVETKLNEINPKHYNIINSEILSKDYFLHCPLVVLTELIGGYKKIYSKNGFLIVERIHTDPITDIEHNLMLVFNTIKSPNKGEIKISFAIERIFHDSIELKKSEVDNFIIKLNTAIDEYMEGYGFKRWGWETM